MSFVHLHLRTGCPYGCGTATPEELVREAGSLALTHRDGLYDIARFPRAVEKAG